MVNKDQCRCGWNAASGKPHPCHLCGKPGESRLYADPRPPRWSLAGVQPKVVVRDTVACRDCWASFQEWLGSMTKSSEGGS